MAYRFILGFLVAASLCGCFDHSGTGTASTSSTSATVASDSATANTPILVQGVPPAGVTVGFTYTFLPNVSANDGVVTFAIEGQPSWTTFDTATGTLSGTPAIGEVGLSGDITIIASNGTRTGTAGPFTIRINAQPPVSSAPPVIGGSPATSVTAGQNYVFQPSANDTAGRALSFSIVNCPAWATFSTATGELSGTPSSAQVGTYSNIAIYVSDGSSSVALPIFAVAVTPSSPSMPVISGQAPIAVVAGQAYLFQPTATDPDSKPLTYSIARMPSWATFSTTTGKLSGTPTSAQIGVDSDIMISASNGTSSASLAPFSITVTSPVAIDTPVINGPPVRYVTAGQTYLFQPTATDPAGQTLTFSILNRPSWADFNTATGELSGTPTAADVGTFPNITISVSDGTASASLPSFPITVTQVANGNATLSWTAPTQNTDGTSLTNLAGYRIYFGTSAAALTRSVQIANSGIVNYVVSNLSPGTWYFSIRAYSTANVESTASAVASAAIN
jgi:Putative Ig domain